MLQKKTITVTGFLLLFGFASFGFADDAQKCHNKLSPISFVEFQSINLEQQPPGLLTIKGKLKIPEKNHHHQNNCEVSKKKSPAVVILHGSAGIDSRGDFYATALNEAGIATLEIDMWEARGLIGGASRPQLPIFTYPDAFAALNYLANHEAIDPQRIGVIGFSWGGVVSLASAEKLYAAQFGQGLTFAAHVAHYPVCYGYNNPTIPALNPPAQRGTQWLNLTGAPVLIQIGTEDDYDNGAENCFTLRDGLSDPNDQHLVEVVAYDGAYHGWDRLLVPITVSDPFADEGSVFSTGVVPEVKMIPDVNYAYQSRKKVVKFFQDNLKRF